MSISAEPKGLQVSEDGQKDLIRSLLLPFEQHAVTDPEWQVLRDMLSTRVGMQAWGNAIRTGLAQIRSITPHLFIPELPNTGRVEAHMALSYRWEQDDEEVRLKRLARQFGGFVSARDLYFDVLDHEIPLLPEWEVDLVVSTVDALLWAGLDPEAFLQDEIDPKAVYRYCELLRHISKVPELRLGDQYEGCIYKNAALPDPDCIRSWMKLPTKQVAGGALTVRRMAVNPGTRFQFNNVVYSLAAQHVPGIVNTLPCGNRVKQVAIGDMITVAAFLNMNPRMMKQIAAGTCTCIDVAGTKLLGEKKFDYSPTIFSGRSGATCDRRWHGFADARFGAFLAAWE